MPEINNKFNGIAGGTINPTFIQDDGEKTEGQYYLDRPTGKLYRCIKTTSNAVNSAEYFKDMSLNSIVNRLENLIKVDAGITGNYITLGSYTYNFPKSYKQVLGVSINIYKTGTATTLENVYLSGFNNAGFTFVKDCVDNSKANTVKIAYTVFYI